MDQIEWKETGGQLAARVANESLNRLGVVAFVAVFPRLFPGVAALLLRLAVLLVLLPLTILLTLAALLAGLTSRFAALLAGLAPLTLLLASFAAVTLLTSVIAVAILVVGIAHGRFLYECPAPLIKAGRRFSVPPLERMMCGRLTRKRSLVCA